MPKCYFLAASPRTAVLAKMKTFPLADSHEATFHAFPTFHNRLGARVWKPVFERRRNSFWVKSELFLLLRLGLFSPGKLPLGGGGSLKITLTLAKDYKDQSMDDILVLYVIFFIHTLFMQVSFNISFEAQRPVKAKAINSAEAEHKIRDWSGERLRNPIKAALAPFTSFGGMKIFHFSPINKVR